MKTVLIGALALFCSALNGQTYLDLPLDNTKWINTLTPVPPGQPSVWSPWQVQFCAAGNDTLINGINYVEVDTCGKGYKGALRNNNGQVFFVPKDSANEFLLYDFTAAEGDTLYNVYYEMAGSWATTEDIYIAPGMIDSVVIDGITRKRININAGWIEGIGNLQGLFWENWYNVSGYAPTLLCMSTNGTTIYPESSFGPCESSFEVEEQFATEQEVALSPNPSDAKITLEWKHAVDEILVYDLEGVEVMHAPTFGESRLTLPVHQLPAGTYFVLLQSNNQRVVKRFIKH